LIKSVYYSHDASDDSVSYAHDAFDDGVELGGVDLVAGNIEGVGHDVGVGGVKTPEHLTSLIITEAGASAVYNDDELYFGVGHVTENLLVFSGIKRAQIKFSMIIYVLSPGASLRYFFFYNIETGMKAVMKAELLVWARTPDVQRTVVFPYNSYANRHL